MRKLHVFSIVLVALTIFSSCEKRDRMEDLQIKEEVTKATKVPLLKNAVYPAEGCSERSYDLMAGQTIFAGSVHTMIDDITGTLYVKYVAADDCKITEAHLFVGGEDAVIPAGKKGNPKIGHFPYFWDGPGEKEEVIFSIMLEDLDLAEGDCIKIAAHAVVNCPKGEETAWAKEDAVFALKTGTSYGSAITGKDAGGWSDNFRYYSVTEGLMNSPIDLVDSEDGTTVNGTVEVVEDGGLLTFTITPAAGYAPVYFSRLYVGSIAGFNHDYGNFPYQIGEVGNFDFPEPFHVFDNIPMPEVHTFDGSRWGWYIMYCPEVCEEDN